MVLLNGEFSSIIILCIKRKGEKNGVFGWVVAWPVRMGSGLEMARRDGWIVCMDF